MANDIGKFFRSQGEERGVEGIADHIRKFWEPRMKKQIFAHLDEGGARDWIRWLSRACRN